MLFHYVEKSQISRILSCELEHKELKTQCFLTTLTVLVPASTWVRCSLLQSVGAVKKVPLVVVWTVEVLIEVDNNILLIVCNASGILDEQLRSDTFYL